MTKTYLLDAYGEESSVTLEQLRKMARNNGILDTDTMTDEDLIDCIENCFPDVTVTVEG